MQINRLFEIIYILMNKQNVTAQELAERFGVSKRTIFRDVDTLSVAGIPVYTGQGKGGGISLSPDFVLNKSILDEQEQNEILSALHVLSNMKTAQTDQVLRKLSTVFNKTAVNWLDVDFSGWGAGSADVFNGLKTAVLQRRIVEFDYYSAYGERTHRRVEPLQLRFKAKTWYVSAFCLTRQGGRLFKLTRVKELVVTDERFPERDPSAAPAEPAPEAHPEAPWVGMKFKIAPEMAYRVYDEFDADTLEIQPDGSFVVTVMWPRSEWTYGEVLSYGEYIEVLEPEDVRGIIREKLRGASAKYL